MHGGPFTEEGVENVKTFLMLIILTLVVVSLIGLAIYVDSQYLHINKNNIIDMWFLSNEN